jgi:hypothetical protein
VCANKKSVSTLFFTPPFRQHLSNAFPAMNKAGLGITRTRSYMLSGSV